MSAPSAMRAVCRSVPRAARRPSLSTRFLPVLARRSLHNDAKRSARAAVAEQLSFPCLDNAEDKSRELTSKRSLAGPEPSYTTGVHQTFHSSEPLLLDWGGILPEFDIAWEAWGTLNADKSNAVLIHTGLSASSHAHSTEANPQPGWWEKFIGPGAPLDTNKYFVICTNVLGG